MNPKNLQWSIVVTWLLTVACTTESADLNRRSDQPEYLPHTDGTPFTPSQVDAVIQAVKAQPDNRGREGIVNRWLRRLPSLEAEPELLIQLYERLFHETDLQQRMKRHMITHAASRYREAAWPLVRAHVQELLVELDSGGAVVDEIARYYAENREGFPPDVHRLLDSRRLQILAEAKDVYKLSVVQRLGIDGDWEAIEALLREPRVTEAGRAAVVEATVRLAYADPEALRVLMEFARQDATEGQRVKVLSALLYRAGSAYRETGRPLLQELADAEWAPDVSRQNARKLLEQYIELERTVTDPWERRKWPYRDPFGKRAPKP